MAAPNFCFWPLAILTLLYSCEKRFKLRLLCFDIPENWRKRKFLLPSESCKVLCHFRRNNRCSKNPLHSQVHLLYPFYNAFGVILFLPWNLCSFSCEKSTRKSILENCCPNIAENVSDLNAFLIEIFIKPGTICTRQPSKSSWSSLFVAVKRGLLSYRSSISPSPRECRAKREEYGADLKAAPEI